MKINNFKLDDLLLILGSEHKVLNDMFQYRSMIDYSYDLALEKTTQRGIEKLLNFGVILQNDNSLQIESDYLTFFEEILNINEEISASNVQDCVDSLKENVKYYFNETNPNKKAAYKDKIRQILKKTAIRAGKNVMALKHNVDDTYKQEPCYANKIEKLKNLDSKANNILGAIKACNDFINNNDTFFSLADDPKLKATCIESRKYLIQADLSLCGIQKQIILFLNKYERQNKMSKKIQTLNYLIDNEKLKSDTSILSILATVNHLFFEPRQYRKTHLSLNVTNDEPDAYAVRLKVAEDAKNYKRSLTIAPPLSPTDIEERIAEMTNANLEKMWKTFAASKHDLFQFVLNYDFGKEMTTEQRANIFCKLANINLKKCEITNSFGIYQNIKYHIIYAKK